MELSLSPKYLQFPFAHSLRRCPTSSKVKYVQRLKLYNSIQVQRLKFYYSNKYISNIKHLLPLTLNMKYGLYATFIKELVAYDQIITLTMTEFFYISIKKILY